MQHTSRRQVRWLGSYDYPLSHRLFELLALGVVGTLGGVMAWRAVGGLISHASPVGAAAALAAAVAAYALADLLSGVVHYVFDTYGSPDTPLIGQKFVKPFRDHHDDPSAMTYGDFIAVNADNFFVALPLVLIGVFATDVREHPLVGAFLLALTFGVVVTNQIHKWCHLADVSRTVTWLQRHGLILSTGEHQRHHTAPYTSHHCITWGRMNPLLNRLVGRRRSL